MVLSGGVVDHFRRVLRGKLVTPADEEYDSVRKVWNLAIEKHPALIARCAGVADVIAAVKCAREHGLELAIRGGSHNAAGKSMSDGGLTIDLSPMKGIRVDPIRRMARAEPGVLLGELDHETQEFGLATTMGVAPDTGIAGLTLGGGYGWLEGKHGLACDNLRSVDIVTADGTLLTASSDENPDLFWGIRGAGANFGVVTSFEYELHPVTTVLGGMLVYPLSRGKEVLRIYDEFAQEAPDELSCVVALLTTPDGMPAVAIIPSYCGAQNQGERVLAPLQTRTHPVADLIHTMTYLEMQQVLVPAFPIGHRYYWKASLVRQLSDAAIEALLEHAATMPTPLSAIGFQQLHGAASRVGVGDTAFPHRFPHHDFFPTAIWTDPADADRCINWVRACWDAMQPYVESAGYVNDLGDEGADRVMQAYGPNYDRLVTLKKQHDPTNLFHMNQNIIDRSR